jgi:type I restriction enzyme S subunit
MASQEINLLKEYKTALIGEVVTGKMDIRQEVGKEPQGKPMRH